MRNEFKTFLISKGMTARSANGSRGTSSDYAWRIFNIIKNEKLGSWEVLAQNLNVILPKYMPGGEFQDYGKRSHESFINALRYFREFVGNRLNQPKTPAAHQKRRFWF